MSTSKWVVSLPFVLLVATAFVSCVTHEDATDADIPNTPDVLERAPIPLAEPRQFEPPEAVLTETIRVADWASTPSIPVRVRPQTFIQRAPSFLQAAFDPIPRVRNSAQTRWNRRWSEARILESDGTAGLYDATLLVFARAVVHEANWIHRPCGNGPGPCDPSGDHNHAEFDAPAMFRVFRNTRRNYETLMGSMRNHMNYATEELPPRRSRSRWIVELNLEGSRPRHFPESDANGNALNWERDYQPRWLEVIALSRRLFAGQDLGVCGGAPLVTWGGRCEDQHGACDDASGQRRGLVPIDCGNSSNRFWCRPGTQGCPTTTIETPSQVETPEMGTEAPPEAVQEN